MGWVQFRSRRDPAFWLPLALIALILVPLGVATNVWVEAWVAELRELARSDPDAALAQALYILRLSSWCFSSFLVVVCAFLFRYFQLGKQEGRLSPSGWWSLGSFRYAVGATARRMTRYGPFATAILLAAALGLVVAVEYVALLLGSGGLAA
jgi:hypothetical protein